MVFFFIVSKVYEIPYKPNAKRRMPIYSVVHVHMHVQPFCTRGIYIDDCVRNGVMMMMILEIIIIIIGVKGFSVS